MVMLRRTLLAAVALSSLPGYSKTQKLTLRAKPGQFDATSTGPASTAASIRGEFRIVEFDTSAKWPPAAYMGLHQGTNRNDSVHVLAVRNRPSDDYLVVGFRHIADGKEVEVRSIQNVPLGSAVRVHMEISEGIATIRVNGTPAIKVVTALKAVAPYVSVSSGAAEFEVDG